MRLFFTLSTLLLLMSGCTAYDLLRHQTFTMRVPQWDKQEIIPGPYIEPSGYFSSSKDCALNITITRERHIALAYAAFERLRALDAQAIETYEIFDTVAMAHYTLSSTSTGDLRILSCPSGYTYLADYSCSSPAYASYSDQILSVLDSMQC